VREKERANKTEREREREREGGERSKVRKSSAIELPRKILRGINSAISKVV